MRIRINKHWEVQIGRKGAGWFDWENVPDPIQDVPMVQCLTVFGISLCYFGSE
jgi:hypothetical protein